MRARKELRRLDTTAGQGQAFKPSLGRAPMFVFVASAIVILD